MTPSEQIIDRVGVRIAKDLAEQDVRSPCDAAAEAGCRSEAEIRAWTERFRAATVAARQQPTSEVPVG